MRRKKRSNWGHFLARQLRDRKFRNEFEKETARLEVGIQVAKLRERRGLSQTQLAALMHTSAPAISRLERGTVSPTLQTLDRVAKALEARLEVRLRPLRLSRRQGKLKPLKWAGVRRGGRGDVAEKAEELLKESFGR